VPNKKVLKLGLYLPKKIPHFSLLFIGVAIELMIVVMFGIPFLSLKWYSSTK
jgi:hypothetical protein